MLLLNDNLKQQTIDNIQNILNHFEVPHRVIGSRITMACPIHSGDNQSGCCIFLDGQKESGNWKCWTNACEETYGYGIIGFVRGLLSKNETVTFEYTKEWIKLFCSHNKHVFTVSAKEFTSRISEPISTMNRIQFRNSVVIPAKYYVDRGYKAATMNKFDVGLCLNRKNPFYMRIVVPVYDEFGYNVIGQVARSPNERCTLCKSYHFANKSCPTNNLEKYWAEKWLNSKGFGKSVTLYNIWNASKFIQKTGKAVLVEGQGDIWKLDEAGIYNAVGMFGSSLSPRQAEILSNLDINELILLTDNDPAGDRAREKIKAKYGHKYDIRHIKYNSKDVGEMQVDQINKEIKDYL